jgi:hypothetical protein
MRPRANRASAARVGGIVTVTPIRNRVSDDERAFTVSWHSPGGDLCWLSPRIPSEESADAAAEVLANFTQSVLARR